MTVESVLVDANEKMDKAVGVLKEELGGVRTGRATPSLLSRLVVDYYGTAVPIQQLATFSVPEPRQLVIQPFDKGAIASMEKAIQQSDIGITPSNDGSIIRLTFPPLTEERRKEYVKVVKHMAEDGRVAVRNVRRDARKHLESAQKAGEISEDDLERAEKEMEKITHEHVEHIDKALERKEHELLEV